jgi:hypothetical protein
MTIPRLTFFNQCEISDYLLGQMLRLGVVQHFTTINVGKGLFQRSSAAPKSIALADIIRENAACLNKSLATSYVERSFFPASWILFWLS